MCEVWLLIATTSNGSNMICWRLYVLSEPANLDTRHTVVFRDNLLSGPSRIGYASHVRARVEYLSRLEDGGLSSYGDLARLRSATLVELHSPKSLAAHVAVAFVCAHREELFPESTLRIIYDSRVGRPPESEIGIADEHDIRGPKLRRATRFWRRFASADPHKVLASVQHLSVGQDQLRSLLRSAFPRKISGRILLSDFDTKLLESARKWIRPSEVLAWHQEDVIGNWVRYGGDAMLAARLQAWSAWPRNAPALDVRMEDPDAPFFRSQYQLTFAGAALLDELNEVNVAPVMPIGGSLAYSSASPFFLA
jgi:hypothetical protein